MPQRLSRTTIFPNRGAEFPHRHRIHPHFGTFHANHDTLIVNLDTINLNVVAFRLGRAKISLNLAASGATSLGDHGGVAGQVDQGCAGVTTS